MSETDNDRSQFGVNEPMYDCTECGDQTVIPGEVERDGVIDLECPSCGNETLTYVDGLCRYGRTLSPHESACYNEWAETWEKPNLTVRLCEEHYDEMTSTPPLPDGAIGRCENDDCTHAVWEETDEGEVICNACRKASSTGGDDGE
jgi:hypothetical protein